MCTTNSIYQDAVCLFEHFMKSDLFNPTQVSAVFIPYGVNCGVGGAVFGLLAVLFVELFQFWQIVDRALLELLQLTGFVAFLLSVGTLPFIDNMAHIGE